MKQVMNASQEYKPEFRPELMWGEITIIEITLIRILILTHLEFSYYILEIKTSCYATYDITCLVYKCVNTYS